MKSKPVILVVDDQPQDIELLETYLAPQGYEIVKAASGEEALKIIAGNQIDLVLLDVVMPGMSGIEVLKKLRAGEKTRFIPVVMNTSFREAENRVKAIGKGCDDFISKPFNKQELLVRVESLLRIKFLHGEVDEARAESIINTVREPLIALDQDLRVVTVSRSFYEIFKVKPEETVGQLIYDLGNKQWDIPKLRELLETILPQKATFDNYEVEHDFATIGRRIMLLNARQIQRGLGKERIILLAIEDITERREIEDRQLKHGAEKQVRSEEQIYILTKAIESTADGVFIIDALKQDFPVIYANQSLRNMTGYVTMETIGNSKYLVYGADSDNRIIDELKHTIRQGEIFHGEMFNFQKDGKKYCNLLRIAPVYDAPGNITHYIGIQTDVTLMREKEFEINEQREEILHVTRVGKLAEFVSSLAHEINQPLTAILSYAQAAQRMIAGRDPELKDILSYIIDDGQRAANVIQRLRMPLKKINSEMKPLDINTLINETMVLVASDAVVRNVFLKLEMESDLPLLNGDPIQLQQVLLNLISNSFDAIGSKRGSREVSICTSRKDNDTIMVAVKDSGGGIPADNMPKLFTHFFTSKPDGLGMGLCISRSIIESHGGRLNVENDPDRSATFYFTIPVHTCLPSGNRTI